MDIQMHESNSHPDEWDQFVSSDTDTNDVIVHSKELGINNRGVNQLLPPRQTRVSPVRAPAHDQSHNQSHNQSHTAESGSYMFPWSSWLTHPPTTTTVTHGSSSSANLVGEEESTSAPAASASGGGGRGDHSDYRSDNRGIIDDDNSSFNSWAVEPRAEIRQPANHFHSA
jgi:hypothetical protein